MIYNFDNLLIPSFTLWIDNILSSQAQAYINTTGTLYKSSDPKIPNYNIYSAPFRQWVADSSVTGAAIPSGFYDNQHHFLTRASGLIIDFQNGRVLTTGNYTNLTGTYPFKEISVKYTNQSEESILFNNVYALQTQYDKSPTTGIDGTVTTIPIVFVKYDAGTDVPFSFGAEFRNTQSSFRCIIISNDPYILENTLGRLRDQTEKIFPIVNSDQLPYNFYGDLKTGYYNYNDLITNQIGYSFVSKVTTFKFNEVANVAISRNIWAGFCDFELETYRNRNGIF